MGGSVVMSRTVDSTPTGVGPPSRISSMRPSRSSRTCSARVGLGHPERLADGAAMGRPLASISARATGWDGTRAATVSSPPVVMSGTVAARGRTRVRGPGQKRAATSRARRGTRAATLSSAAALARWTINGLPRGRSLASKIRATARPDWASAPSPYTVSVGKATSPPARITSAPRRTPASSASRNTVRMDVEADPTGGKPPRQAVARQPRSTRASRTRSSPGRPPKTNSAGSGTSPSTPGLSGHIPSFNWGTSTGTLQPGHFNQARREYGHESAAIPVRMQCGCSRSHRGPVTCLGGSGPRARRGGRRGPARDRQSGQPGVPALDARRPRGPVGGPRGPPGLLAHRQGSGARTRGRHARRGAQVGRAPDQRARPGDGARARHREPGQGPRFAAGRPEPDRRQAEPGAARGHPPAAAQRTAPDRRLPCRTGALERRAQGVREQRHLRPAGIAVESDGTRRPEPRLGFGRQGRAGGRAGLAVTDEQLPGHLRRRQDQGPPERGRAPRAHAAARSCPRRRGLLRALALRARSLSRAGALRARVAEAPARVRRRDLQQQDATEGRPGSQAPRPRRRTARPGGEGRGFVAGERGRGPALRGPRHPHRHPLDGLHSEQLDFEDERGARRNDVAGAAIAVAQVRGDDELALAAHLHGGHALVPALDDAALADGEGERLSAVHRAVELLAALEPARVMHAHRFARLGPGARALDEVDVLEPGRRLNSLLVHGLEFPLSRTIARRRMESVTYRCAFCGEENDVLVDPSGGRHQTFTEDCTVCCRPNLITLVFEGDDVRLDAVQEYEA